MHTCKADRCAPTTAGSTGGMSRFNRGVKRELQQDRICAPHGLRQHSGNVDEAEVIAGFESLDTEFQAAGSTLRARLTPRIYSR